MTEFKNSKNQESATKNKGKYLLNKIKSHSQSKTFIAVTFLIFGIGSTILTQTFANKISNGFSSKESIQDQQIKMIHAWQREVNKLMKDSLTKEMDRSDKFFDDFYSNSFDPFTDMADIHNRMRERFSNFDKYFSDNFDEIQKQNYPTSTRTSVSQKEDKNFIYYQLNFSGFNKDEISVKIENKTLSFSAKKLDDTKSKNEESVSTSKTSSNFLYSFSIPNNARLENPEIIKENGKIIVKFSK